SPYNFAILKTKEELDKDRQHILKPAQPIYNLQPHISKEQIDQFTTDIAEKWQSSMMDTLLNLDIDDYKEKGTQLLTYVYNRGITAHGHQDQTEGMDPGTVDDTEANSNFSVLSDNVAQQKNTVDCFTIETAHEYLQQTLQRDRSISKKSWLGEVLENSIT